MITKVNTIFIILGLFLFKVGIIDNFRKLNSSGRGPASEKPLPPIR